ncbi:MAG: recombinase family protein [Candidatus Sulfotelmatobacter sp.]|nr:recombinase family protein [Candidatus Sulfotelmatobacter sp.]
MCAQRRHYDRQLVPVAQYLRMSTEHQQYSLENQCAMMQEYAQAQGFEIVRTYSDAARSGLVLKRRLGLRQLLQDVVASGASAYRAILVYDVSRWGRFQDTDESAHYEFLCKSAGVPVHYCAETFANDGSLPSLIMKALKRTMAGEYSRELGVKVLAGQRRLARLGFKQGGVPGYGLRRMLISAEGTRKQFLTSGERKSIATDRVILVPGPAHEVQIVRDIYRMLVSERLSVYAIAGKLNRGGVVYLGDTRWNYQAVYAILSHPKYAGWYVFGRTSSKLSTPTVKLPKTTWIVKSEAFEPIIDYGTFTDAERILQSRTIKRSNEEILDNLRKLLVGEGRLSLSVIKKSADTPSPSTYRHRFGSLRRAYQLIGYGKAEQFGPIDQRRRTQAMRDELIARIVALFPRDVSVIRPGGRWRSRLRMRNGTIVSVLVARSLRTWKTSVRWRIDPVRQERRLIWIGIGWSETSKCVTGKTDWGLLCRSRAKSRRAKTTASGPGNFGSICRFWKEPALRVRIRSATSR